MSILLLAGLIASIVTLASCVVFLTGGEFRRVGRIALRWGACVAAYAAILAIAAIMTRHDSALKIGESYCDDDMCMSVRNVSRTGGFYQLSFLLFSRANHGLRSAKGVSVYLTDERKRRFLPVPGPSAIPFDVAVEPGQSVDTALTFPVPADVHTVWFAAATDHIQYASFIIGNGDLLHYPRLRLRIQ